jgi:hypothetical protein
MRQVTGLQAALEQVYEAKAAVEVCAPLPQVTACPAACKTATDHQVHPTSARATVGASTSVCTPDGDSAARGGAQGHTCGKPACQDAQTQTEVCFSGPEVVASTCAVGNSSTRHVPVWNCGAAGGIPGGNGSCSSSGADGALTGMAQALAAGVTSAATASLVVVGASAPACDTCSCDSDRPLLQQLQLELANLQLHVQRMADAPPVQPESMAMPLAPPLPPSAPAGHACEPVVCQQPGPAAVAGHAALSLPPDTTSNRGVVGQGRSPDMDPKTYRSERSHASQEAPSARVSSDVVAAMRTLPDNPCPDQAQQVPNKAVAASTIATPQPCAEAVTALPPHPIPGGYAAPGSSVSAAPTDEGVRGLSMGVSCFCLGLGLYARGQRCHAASTASSDGSGGLQAHAHVPSVPELARQSPPVACAPPSARRRELSIEGEPAAAASAVAGRTPSQVVVTPGAGCQWGAPPVSPAAVASPCAAHLQWPALQQSDHDEDRWSCSGSASDDVSSGSRDYDRIGHGNITASPEVVQEGSAGSSMASSPPQRHKRPWRLAGLDSVATTADGAATANAFLAETKSKEAQPLHVRLPAPRPSTPRVWAWVACWFAGHTLYLLPCQAAWPVLSVHTA